MATTSNYSWTTPDDTDLVKDGASAIRTLGSAIDTTVFNNAGAAVAKSTVDAKGDLIVGTANDTVGRLAVGTDGYTLVADSVETTGLKWVAPATGGGMTSIASGTLSSTSTLITSIPTTYNELVLYIDGWTVATTGWGLYLRLNDDSNSNRYFDNIAFAQNGTATTFNANHMKISRDNFGVTSSSKQFVFVTIPLYANTTSWKLANYYSISQDTTVTTSFVNQAGSGFYNQTAAITSIRILNGASANQSGNYALYGVK